MGDPSGQHTETFQFLSVLYLAFQQELFLLHPFLIAYIHQITDNLDYLAIFNNWTGYRANPDLSAFCGRERKFLVIGLTVIDTLLE